jgi:acetyltransferase
MVPLAERSHVMIRAISAADAPMLQAFIRRLSVRSRRFRFFSALHDLSAEQLDELVRVDQRQGLALVALAERSEQTAIVAEARCVLDEASGDGEFAIAVADEYQRRGLGTKLMCNLLAYASWKGVRQLFGEIMVDNQPMLALARCLGFQIKTNISDARTLIASIFPSNERRRARLTLPAARWCNLVLRRPNALHPIAPSLE